MHNRLALSSLCVVATTALATALVFAQTTPTPTTPAPDHFLPDVKIDQCFVQPPKLMSKQAGGTQIVYENVGTTTYSSVTFLVGYRNAESNYRREVTDQGAFAPGAKINHHFSLYNDVTYSGKTTTTCGAISGQH